jgi:tetratricopeptide (TPR) repeat protein/transcriptional regulator with XRE-family HTH domain
VIEHLARCLAAAVPDCTAEEIADVLWLITAIAGQPGGAGSGQRDIKTRPELPTAPPPMPAELDVSRPVRGARRAGLAIPAGTGSAPGGRISPATAVGFRAPPSITHPLGTARALSSFRRVHRPGVPQVDIEATIEASADAHQLVVVTSPARERGLDVALVVDTSPVMTACRTALAQFERLLQQSGAFRSVSRWTLIPTAASQEPEDYAAQAREPGALIRDTSGTEHHPDRLLDPSGRRLVLVATDALADHWYQPGLWQVLSRWARHMPTAAIQVLPTRYRVQTALGDSAIFIRARRPADSNSTADVQAPWWDTYGDEATAGAVPVPVVALTPRALATWSQAVTAGTAWVEAVWAQQPVRPGPREANATVGATDRVKAFEARASAGAQTLARVLAAAPVLSWQLIAILQAGLAPSTGPMELAEVLAGGLLERVNAQVGFEWADRFRFRPGVIELLRRGTTSTQEWDTFELISDYLEKTARTGTDIRALIANPRGAIQMDADLEPFAALGQSAAERLGLRLEDSYLLTAHAQRDAATAHRITTGEAPFAGRLRRLRAEAGLLPEELASKAAISARSIDDLERGVNLRPRRDTVRQLADALKLVGRARLEFEAAALRPDPVGIAGTLPMDIPAFSGREQELRALAKAAAAATAGVMTICAIGGMAGIGKTALAVHAAHQFAAMFSDGQIFLPLHAHTPAREPIDPAAALTTLLQASGAAAQQIPSDVEAMADMWRERLIGRKMLLIYDDAADSAQVEPLLPKGTASLVIVTSRNRLAALDGAVIVSLDALPPTEAAELLVRLAARPGLDENDASVAEICQRCGYLPLAIGLVAGRMRRHESWTTSDVAADLALATNTIAPSRAENLSVAAAFDLSYRDLGRDQQRMFRRLGLHPGTDIDVYAAASLGDVSLSAARTRLEELSDHYLLTEPARERYRFHDLIREYARQLADTDGASDRAEAVGRLLDYYMYMANLANRQLRGGGIAELTGESNRRKPKYAPDIASRSDAIAWLSAERLNLQAAASSAGAHGRPMHAAALAAAMHAFLRSQGHWDQAMALHRVAIDIARNMGTKHVEARALANLGEVQHLTDDYAAAEASLRTALQIWTQLDDRLGQADALRELGAVQLARGEHDAAAESLTRALNIYEFLTYRHGQADALRGLGSVELVRGHYQDAARNLDRAATLYRAFGDRIGEADTLNDIGAVQLATGDYPGATRSQRRALDRYRELGDRLGEANALTDLGTVQQMNGSYEEAQASLHRVVQLYRELGDHSGETKALNNLGELALRTGDHEGAREMHERALAIATKIAAPREQARAHEGIGRSYLVDGQIELGHAAVRKAVQIYQQIGSPHAGRTAKLLRLYGP